MKKRSFFWYILPSFLFISGLCSVLLFLYTTKEFKQFYLNQTTNELKTRAILFQQKIKELLFDSPQFSQSHINNLAITIGNKTNTRFTVILPNGKVIADSKESPNSMDNHSNRVEIIKAFEKEIGVSIRHSFTLSRDLLYVAIPLFKPEKDSVVAIVRASVPLTTLSEQVGIFSNKLIIAGIIIIFTSFCLSIILSSRLSRPIVLLKNIADNYAKGNFSLISFGSKYPEEISNLASSMDYMAKQLTERIHTITTQKNEENAILTSLIEGVIAIDKNELIIMINEAAGKIFNISPHFAKGKLVQEAIRNTQFQKFVQKLIEKKVVLKKEITIISNPNRIIEITGTPFYGTDKSEVQGLLTILYDVSHLKKLEKMRKNFVADVSHELRTPLTSIKGFVETLQDGAKNNKETLEKFLAIIHKQVNRINSLLADLLTLSQIEKEESSEDIEFENVNLYSVMSSAATVCVDRAREKNITLSLEGDTKITASVNASLIEQALINLIDNAIKYSKMHTQVTIKAAQADHETMISVIDQGQGISKEHLPRIFERFYRVDKARSKKLGGTGLGLAIVKHIVYVHRGTITVDSDGQNGTMFTISLKQVLNSKI